jgi:hypothetical protein
MSIYTWKGRALAGGLVVGLVALGSSAAVAAPKGKKAAEAAAPAPEVGAPTTKTTIEMVPKGVKWGMTQGDLETVVDGFIDASAKPDYKKATSGPALRDLETRISQAKSAFRRTKIELTAGPTGLDSSPIAPEYTKGNGEMLMRHDHAPGQRIWFFFIGGRLWKTLEEVNLVDKGPYGKDISEAATKLVASVGGTMPRATAADPGKGKYYDVVDWQDSTTHLRVWDRGGTVMIVREDKSILGNFSNLCKNHVASGPGAIDPQVAAALRGPDAPEGGDKGAASPK